MAVHATAADLIVRFDQNTIGDLLSDTGTPVAVAQFATNPKLVALLLASSGRLEAACLISKMYSVADLDGLTGNSLALKKSIVCDDVMSRLMGRRPEKFGRDYVKAIRDEVELYITMLRKGERIFDVETVEAAGLPTVDGPSTVDYTNMNLLPDRVKNYYPGRKQRLPLGR